LPGNAALLRVAALAALASVIACSEILLPPAADRLLVHGVVNADSGEIAVKVGWVNRQHQTDDSATVTITTPLGRVINLPLVTKLDTTYFLFGGYGVETDRFYYVAMSAVSDSVIPGGTYTLNVVAKNGQTVTGTTTVPVGPVTVDSASGVISRAQDTVRLSWPRAAGDVHYEVEVSRIGLATGLDADYLAFTDTSVVLAGTMRNREDEEVFLPGGTYLVAVYVVDDNYHDYYRTITDPFSGATPSRLTGAVGVFGAVAPIKKRVYQVNP
jgi:hypothetical protein